MAAELAAGSIVSFFTLGTGGPFVVVRVAIWTYRLNRIRGLIEKAKDLVGVVKSFKDILRNVSELGPKYSTFKKQFDEKLAEFRSLKDQLDIIESKEGLDEKLEKIQEKTV